MIEEKRLHPIYIFYSFIQSYKLLLPFIFIIFQKTSLVVKVSMISIIIIFNIVLYVIKYFKMTYSIKDGILIYKTGLIYKNKVELELANVQNVDTSQNLLNQIFNLVSLDINLINDKISLSPITKAEANRVISLINKNEVLEQNDRKSAVLSFSFVDLVIFGFVKLKFFGTLFILVNFIDDFVKFIKDIFGDKLDRFTSYFNFKFSLNPQSFNEILPYLILIIVIVAIVSITRSFIQYYGCLLINKDDKIIYKAGLFNKKSIVIKKEKIQKIIIEENLRSRFFGMLSLRITTLSSDVLENINDRDGILLIPLARKKLVYNFLENILEVDYRSYENEKYEKIPKSAYSIIRKWSILYVLLLAFGLCLFIYSLPALKSNLNVSVFLASIILIIFLVRTYFSYKLKINYTSTAFTDEMIINKEVNGLEKNISYLKPVKISDITYTTNIFLKKKDIFHFKINCLGSFGDINIKYFHKSFLDKFHNYLLEREKNNG